MRTCRFCGTAMANNAASCPNCGLSQFDSGMQAPQYDAPQQFTAPQQQLDPVQREVQREVMRTYRRVSFAGRIIGLLVLIFFAAFTFFAIRFIPPILKDMEEHDASMQQKKEEFEKHRQEYGTMPAIGTDMPASGSDLPDISSHFDPIAPEDYFEVTDTLTYQNSFGGTVIIRKVLAKQDAALISTVSFQGADRRSLNNSSDRIVLTEGEPNYFRYILPDGIPEGEEPEFKEHLSIGGGSRTKNAVELISWSQDESGLNLNVRQNAEQLSPEARFKLLFYKEGQLVYDEFGVFAMNTDELKGPGSEASLTVLLVETDFDDIEFYYEP